MGGESTVLRAARNQQPPKGLLGSPLPGHLTDQKQAGFYDPPPSDCVNLLLCASFASPPAKVSSYERNAPFLLLHYLLPKASIHSFSAATSLTRLPPATCRSLASLVCDHLLTTATPCQSSQLPRRPPQSQTRPNNPVSYAYSLQKLLSRDWPTSLPGHVEAASIITLEPYPPPLTSSISAPEQRRD